MHARRPHSQLGRLDGVRTSAGCLRLVAARRGRFREETDAVLTYGEEAAGVIEAKQFAGRPSAWADPWIEASLPRDDETVLSEIVTALAGLLPPRGRLMIVYGADETERLLGRRFPVVLTPVGAALLEAGCTWFKDWYFAEGGREGEAKLQGNLPANPVLGERQREAIRARLAAWLEVRTSDGDELGARVRERLVRVGRVLAGDLPGIEAAGRRQE